ncbi:MAG: extracellular solute-binding protein, partial [Clostridia bacterium]|nr:extracellular solute-binding protein [Clostridia bacterium]
MKKKLSFILAILLMLQVFAPVTSVFAADAEPLNTITLFESADGLTYELDSLNTYSFNVPVEARYLLEMDYITVYEKPVTPQVGIVIDGDNELVLDAPHSWKVILNEESGRFDTDDLGNERLPAQDAVSEKQTIRFLVANETGSTEKGVLFTAGEHSIRFNMIREKIIVYSIRLVLANTLQSYEDYKAANKTASSPEGFSETYEAELADKKSHAEISVTYDRSSPAITPNDPVKIMYNVIGGTGFANPGQWLEWKINVPEDGYYCIDFKYRQNAAQGQSVRRQVYIDGEILFEDFNEVLFNSADGFAVKTLSTKDGKEAPVYLTKGEHSVRLKVILGAVAEPLEKIQNVIRTLNELYTQIVIIVGETPDAYRDYNLADHIPGLLETFTNSANELRAIIPYFEEGDGERNSNTASIEQVINLLDELSESERKAPTEQDNLRAQINTLASLVSSMSTQPLELDSLTVRSTNVPATAKNVGFWETFVYRFKSFVNSFVGDYNAIGAADGKDNKKIDIWVTVNGQEVAGFATGRDQAQIVTQLVRSSFYEETGIMTNIALMDSATILQAFVSGKGPDVAIFVPTSVLANLYFRNAVVDLAAEMPDFDKVKERVYPSAFVPLSYKDRVYALPEVQSYNMLYYRTDIFEKHGLSVPKTWDEFYDTTIKLQKAGMEIGIAGMEFYHCLLMQNGGSLYNEELTATNFTTEESIKAFTQYTEMYTKYGLPLSFSALDRFRTGQIPMLISTATFFNNLTLGAIEIANLWSMAPMPGTVQA